MILSHHLSRASRDPARTTPQAASPRNLCVLRVSTLDFSSLGLILNLQLSTFNRVSFLSSHLSSSQRSAKSFTIRTSETPLPQPLYNPHLRAPLGSAGNKRLITPLESTLTKNSPVSRLESALTKRGGWGSFLPLRNSPHAILSLPTMFKSFLFRRFHTLLHWSKTQPFSFQAIPNSLRKTPGYGGGTLIFPTINAISSARSPRALPLTLALPQHTIPPFRRSQASRTLSAGAIA